MKKNKNIHLHFKKQTINCLALFVCLLFFVKCQTHTNKQTPEVSAYTLISDTTIKYAKLFSISTLNDIKIIHLFGHKNKPDTTVNFILYKKEKPVLNLKNAHYIKIPCTKIVSLSSIYTSMLTELDALPSIVGIENIDYYNNAKIVDFFKLGKLKELQKNPLLDRETTLKLNPDVIFAFGMGNANEEFDIKIIEKGIPVVIAIDHLEKSPLARAEWLKFFAAFVDQSEKADRIFSSVSNNYNQLKSKAQDFKIKPTVFTELKFGDTWFVPGGKSYMAYLIKDANANYVWQNDSTSGSIPLSFESVYAKANTADFWLNVSMCTNLNEILSQDKRYANFKAFKTKKVFNNNKMRNNLNYTAYWESGMIFPDKILNDLIYIFHQTNADTLNNNLYYYMPVL